MSDRRTLIFAAVLLAAAFIVAGLGPRERVLGASVRIVYLHGAWVWAALIALGASAAAGAVGLVGRRAAAHRWSTGLGRGGTIFWLTSLLLSLWAMDVNWNGLFLAEPRWRLGVQFGVGAVLLQTAAILIRRPAVGSLLNLVFFLSLAVALISADSVLHPSSPIGASTSAAIRLHFAVLLALTTGAALQLARVLRPSV